MILERGAAIVRLPASRSALDLRAFGSLIELAGGLHLSDRRGHPTCAPIPFTDALAGVSGALAAVQALRDGRRRLRIVGQLEDVAGALVR